MTDGEKVKQRLKELGMQKTEFAKRLGTTSQYVYMLFKTKEIGREKRKKIEGILSFRFDENDHSENFKAKYVKLLEKYTALLEEHKEFLKKN